MCFTPFPCLIHYYCHSHTPTEATTGKGKKTDLLIKVWKYMNILNMAYLYMQITVLPFVVKSMLQHFGVENKFINLN